jgi:hypothetical protein
VEDLFEPLAWEDRGALSEELLDGHLAESAGVSLKSNKAACAR